MHNCATVCAILGDGRSHCEVNISIERKVMLSLLQVSITVDLVTMILCAHTGTVVVDPFPSPWWFISKSCISSPNLAGKAVHQRMGIQRDSKSLEELG